MHQNNQHLQQHLSTSGIMMTKNTNNIYIIAMREFDKEVHLQYTGRYFHHTLTCTSIKSKNTSSRNDITAIMSAT